MVFWAHAQGPVQIKETLPKVDLFIELLDARIPFSSENPMLANLRGDKLARSNVLLIYAGQKLAMLQSMEGIGQKHSDQRNAL